MAEQESPGGVVDPINVGTALGLISRKPGEPAPYACCPSDGEPLISTMRFSGAEFYCVACEVKYGFLAPTPKTPTPELDARHAELQAQFDERFPR